MAGKSLDNLKVTHEEVISQLAMQLASAHVDLTVLKLENQKLKEYIANSVEPEVKK
jgi:regulator of replication initiation timing